MLHESKAFVIKFYLFIFEKVDPFANDFLEKDLGNIKI